MGQLIGRSLRGERVVDVGIRPDPVVSFAWDVATVALGSRRRFARRRPPHIVDWPEATELFTVRSTVASRTGTRPRSAVEAPLGA